MLYIYRCRGSKSARYLAHMLQGRRARGEIGLLRSLHRGDAVVCWGERLAPREGVMVLNGGPLSDKMEDAIRLRQENIPTVEVSLAPGAVNRAEVLRNRLAQDTRGLSSLLEHGGDAAVVRQQRDQLIATFDRWWETLRETTPPREWLPRSFYHTGGGDLLIPPQQPDYYALKIPLVREFRVHSFLGRSIRAGIKILREGWQLGQQEPGQLPAHPWVRSWQAGWRISYQTRQIRQAHRDLAHQVVRALSLDFGAVDIGEKADGSLVVLECNRAPGLEGGTISAYVKAIQLWLEGRANGSPQSAMERLW